MVVLKPLSQDIRPPRIGIRDEKKKSASLILTYTDEIQPAFKQLLDDFKANAQTLGVDVDMIDHWGDYIDWKTKCGYYVAV